MKLLVSCVNEEEADAAVKGGADIIDVKNPKEGPLGASFPWTIKSVKSMLPNDVEVSCTLGDLPNLPGSVSLAALGASTTGVNYLKVGLGKVKMRDEAVSLLKSAVKAANDFNPAIKVVATGYADSDGFRAVCPQLIPEIAREANANVAMVDTAVKNGANLFSFLTRTEIGSIVDDGHERGLQVALAGSLRKEHLKDVLALKADIVGVRGAVCTEGNRLKGQVTSEAVADFRAALRQMQAEVAAVR